MTTTIPAALVTGAGRGLGRGIAELLADRGYLVMVTDLDAETAASTAEEIGRGALWAEVDVREQAQVENARDELLAAAGSLDVWVNNAGVLFTGPAWERAADLRKLQLDVNALGTINGTIAAIDAMRGSGGHIINIASLAGLSAVPGEAVYAASKHAVLGFSSSTAADLRMAGVKNIDISCICPDGIWTPMLYDKVEDPQAALSFSGVLLQPEEVVKSVGNVLDTRKAVTALPAWRGMMARCGAAFPRIGAALLPLMAAQGRREQKRLHQSQELPRR